MTLTQRTLKLLRDEYRFKLVGKVELFEHNNRTPHGLRRDLFNIFDIVVSDPAAGIIGVQSCGTDYAAHYRKITEDYKRNAEVWIHSGGRIFLIGWRKVKKIRGGKQMVYKPRQKEITLDDLK